MVPMAERQPDLASAQHCRMSLELTRAALEVDRSRLGRRSENSEHPAVAAGGVTGALATEEPRPLRRRDDPGLDARAMNPPPLAVDLGERAWKRRRHGPYEVVNAHRRLAPVDAPVLRPPPAEVLLRLDDLRPARRIAGNQSRQGAGEHDFC